MVTECAAHRKRRRCSNRPTYLPLHFSYVGEHDVPFWSYSQSVHNSLLSVMFLEQLRRSISRGAAKRGPPAN